MMHTERSLRLRPARTNDEASFRSAHDALAADGIAFGLGFTSEMSWDAYLERTERYRVGIGLPADRVPATSLVAEVAGVLVGRVSIRHTLNDSLRREGGHIGYAVLPQYRRRGYATEILRQSLIIARSLGVDQILITCDRDNIGSRKVIEACGGVLDSTVTPQETILRYWIM